MSDAALLLTGAKLLGAVVACALMFGIDRGSPRVRIVCAGALVLVFARCAYISITTPQLGALPALTFVTAAVCLVARVRSESIAEER